MRFAFSKLLLALVAGLFWLTGGYAQKLNTLRGTIIDKSGGVPGATVYLLNTNFKTTTNAKGEYVLGKIPDGRYEINVSAIGYASITKTINVSVLNNPRISFTLTPSDSQLSEVVVSAQKREAQAQNIAASVST